MVEQWQSVVLYVPGLEAAYPLQSQEADDTSRILSGEAKHRQATFITFLNGTLFILLSEEIPPIDLLHTFLWAGSWDFLLKIGGGGLFYGS